MKKPECSISRGLLRDARQEEVRIKADVDREGNILKLHLLEYGFGLQFSPDWHEDGRNKVYNFLVEYNWKVSISRAIKSLSPKEVLTEGYAFKKAYFKAYDMNLPVDKFIEEVEKEYEKNKKQCEQDYKDVVDIADLKKILIGNSQDKGLGFKPVDDV